MKNVIQKIIIMTGIIFSTSAYATPDSMESFLKEQGIVISLREEFKQKAVKQDNIEYQTGTNLDSLGSFVASKLGLKNQDKNKDNKLVAVANTFLGVPYKFGGNSEDGLDCSALVQLVYEKASGIVLPRVAAQQAKTTRKIAKSDLKPGDLVFFNTRRKQFSHVGIYIGDNQFIHAPRTGANVRVENMDKSYWTSRFNGARRVNSEDFDKVAQNDS